MYDDDDDGGVVVVIIIICRACNTFCLIRCHIHICEQKSPHVRRGCSGVTAAGVVWYFENNNFRGTSSKQALAGYCLSSNEFKCNMRTHTCFFCGNYNTRR